MCAEHENIPIFQSIYVCSSVNDFSKEQNKLSTGTVCHKDYCYTNFLSRFGMRLFSKVAVICRNYNHRGVTNFKFNFTFHNVLNYNRATFNNRVECCVDFTRESWQPVDFPLFSRVTGKMILFSRVHIRNIAPPGRDLFWRAVRWKNFERSQYSKWVT